MARRLKTQARTAAQRRRQWPAVDFASAPAPADPVMPPRALALLAAARLSDRTHPAAPVLGVL